MPRVSTGESATSRVVRVLDAFRSGDTSLSVSQIAGRSGLPMATASRYVAEMAASGLLARTVDGRVQLGLRLWELASRASPTLALRQAAMPVMERLHARVGHHVQLGVREGADVLFLERLTAPDAVINYSRIAGRLPLHASSSGLVLLASAPRDVRESVLAAPLHAFTDATITAPAQLRAQLSQVRREGYALLPGHMHPDAVGIAAPVRSGSAVIAALSVIVPNTGSARRLVGSVRSAADEVSLRISQSLR